MLPNASWTGKISSCHKLTGLFGVKTEMFFLIIESSRQRSLFRKQLYTCQQRECFVFTATRINAFVSGNGQHGTLQNASLLTCSSSCNAQFYCSACIGVSHSSLPMMTASVSIDSTACNPFLEVFKQLSAFIDRSFTRFHNYTFKGKSRTAGRTIVENRWKRK